LDGLELVDPGIVQLQDWRPEPSQPGPQAVPALGGVGRKR
jgi:S-adenosyl methyltransferase